MNKYIDQQITFQSFLQCGNFFQTVRANTSLRKIAPVSKKCVRSMSFSSCLDCERLSHSHAFYGASERSCFDENSDAFLSAGVLVSCVCVSQDMAAVSWKVICIPYSICKNRKCDGVDVTGYDVLPFPNYVSGKTPGRALLFCIYGR